MVINCQGHRVRAGASPSRHAGDMRDRVAQKPLAPARAASRKSSADVARRSSRRRAQPAIRGTRMTLPRRRVLHLAAGAVALPLSSAMAQAQDHKPPAAKTGEQPLAERLAAYALGLRYEDLDDATIERVKTHVIDTIGCGMGAFDEKPVRICRDVALSVTGPASVIGTDRKTTEDLAAFANGAAFRYLDFNDTYVGR